MSSLKHIIREVTDDELIRSAKVVRDSFKTVAVELGLTKRNCPTPPSFMNVRKLYELRDRGIKLFGLFLRELQVGFVAIEKVNEILYHMERLAVLPNYRHKDYGAKLIRFVFDYIGNNGGRNSR